jgi:DNA-directed RNA polymerase specialized sigma24 family protein
MEDKVREIWENFDKQLRGYICTKMNNNNECLDVLQDVYLKIIKNIDKISAIENIPSYLNGWPLMRLQTITGSNLKNQH